MVAEKVKAGGKRAVPPKPQAGQLSLGRSDDDRDLGALAEFRRDFDIVGLPSVARAGGSGRWRLGCLR